MQGKTLYDRCRQTGKQALLDQWHPDRNSGLTPGQVTAGSHKKVWWRCKMGHEWQAEVRSRYHLEGKKACRIQCEKAITQGFSEENWQEMQNWLCEHIIKLEKAIHPHIAGLKNALQSQRHEIEEDN